MLKHGNLELHIGGVYISVLHREEYAVQGVEGPWRLENFFYIDDLLVLRIFFLHTRWRANLALQGHNWKREVTKYNERTHKTRNPSFDDSSRTNRFSIECH